MNKPSIKLPLMALIAVLLCVGLLRDIPVLVRQVLLGLMLLVLFVSSVFYAILGD